MSHNRLSVALELKEASEDGTFKGYGSVFNVKDSASDMVDKGAFLASLGRWEAKGMMPPMLWQHDMKSPIGRYNVMREDESGLYVEGKFSMAVEKAREAHALLKDGVISGLSIGYMTVKSQWDEQENVRRLKEVDLFEVSLVTMPANEMAQVLHVKAAEQIQTERDFEAFLKLQGYSQSQAKAITATGFKGLSHRDDDKISEIKQRDVAGIAVISQALQSLNETLSKGL